eukprot:480797_1
MSNNVYKYAATMDKFDMRDSEWDRITKKKRDKMAQSTATKSSINPHGCKLNCQKSISAFIYAACQPKMPSLTITSGIGAANSRCGVYFTNHANQSDSIKLREYRVDGAFMMVNN